MQSTWSNLRATASLVVLCLGVTGCETPVNDVALPPAPAEETADVIDDEAVLEDVALDTHSVPSVPDAEPTSVAGDTQADEEVLDDADKQSCASATACLDYWVGFSECSVASAGPDAAIDPSVYEANCAATCDLADRLDYVGHYTCLSAGIPEDCSLEPAHVPDCEI